MQTSRRMIEIGLELNWSRLFGYALTLTNDADNARDVIQQGAVNALASRNPPADAKAIRAWLFKIVRNVWIDQYRRRRVRNDDTLDGDLAPGAWNYDNQVIAEITVRQGLAWARSQPWGEVVDVLPRYHPRWSHGLVRVPVLRELLTWNLVIVVRKA